MKSFLLASILCLSSVALRAQEKPQQPVAPPKNFLIFPAQGSNPGLDLFKDFGKPVPAQTHAIELKGFAPVQSGVCSVPLLEVHVDAAIDPGMTFTPPSTAVAIPQARVPAPSCQKK